MQDVNEIRDQFSTFKGKPFRPGQAEAICHVLESNRKAIIISAPTGSGKSLIGMVSGAPHGCTGYLCSSKQLQAQLIHDFPEARYMWGRSNFTCNQDPNRTADLCLHSQTTPCSLKSQCEYEGHKRSVLQHQFQILNYSYFLTESNYVGKFSNYPFVVCDEADVLESLLTGFIELRLSRSRLDSLKLAPPRYRTSTAKDGLSSWRQWVEKESKAKIFCRMSELQGYIGELSPGMELTPEDCQKVKEYKSLEGLGNKLAMFEKHMDDSWIYQEQQTNGRVDAWIFQPTWLTPELAQEYFWRHGEKFLLMSATFPPKPVLAEMLGLPVGDLDYVEIPSTFPVSNRPVILDPAADMSFKTFEDELPKLLDRIEKIIDKHRGEKGLIHTCSWRLNEAIMRLGNPRMITHNSHDKESYLEAFRQSKDGIFVSPSSMRGVDLPDDLCRFIVIAKAPFESLADKLVSARVYGSGLGAFWYRAVCAQYIVQASGRGVRHHHDHCITYLLDKQIERLVVDNQLLFPRYWMEALDYA